LVLVSKPGETLVWDILKPIDPAAMIERMSPCAYWVPRSDTRFLDPHWENDVCHPAGGRRLYVDSDAKAAFVAMSREAARLALDALPHIERSTGLLPEWRSELLEWRSRLPKWHSDGSDDEFRRWRMSMGFACNHFARFVASEADAEQAGP
jgi:hypothetical protein